MPPSSAMPNPLRPANDKRGTWPAVLYYMRKRRKARASGGGVSESSNIITPDGDLIITPDGDFIVTPG